MPPWLHAKQAHRPKLDCQDALKPAPQLGAGEPAQPLKTGAGRDAIRRSVFGTTQKDAGHPARRVAKTVGAGDFLGIGAVKSTIQFPLSLRAIVRQHRAVRIVEPTVRTDQSALETCDQISVSFVGVVAQ